ncbi:hypothetical protein CsSME_00021305 [Camellia sinensis var. sinensis]
MERYKDLDVARLTVLHTDQGRVLDGVSRCISMSSTLKGEAHAIWLACFLADVHNLQQVEIENDNRTMILLCFGESPSMGSGCFAEGYQNHGFSSQFLFLMETSSHKESGTLVGQSCFKWRFRFLLG